MVAFPLFRPDENDATKSKCHGIQSLVHVWSPRASGGKHVVSSSSSSRRTPPRCQDYYLPTQWSRSCSSRHRIWHDRGKVDFGLWEVNVVLWGMFLLLLFFFTKQYTLYLYPHIQTSLDKCPPTLEDKQGLLTSMYSTICPRISSKLSVCLFVLEIRRSKWVVSRAEQLASS